VIWFCLVAHPTIARAAKTASIVGDNLIGALSTTLIITEPSKKFGQSHFRSRGLLENLNCALAVAASMSSRLRRYMPIAS
jgi:hypothetical protein